MTLERVTIKPWNEDAPEGGGMKKKVVRRLPMQRYQIQYEELLMWSSLADVDVT